MTKKEIDKIRNAARLELYVVLLQLEYGIDDMELMREEFRESATYMTKNITKVKKKFTKLKDQYEKITGRKYTSKR